MASDFEVYKEEFTEAVENDKRPKDLKGMDLERHVPGSANKHVLKNVAVAVAVQKERDAVLDWAEWYVKRPLHENEATTPSESYRPAISEPTYALAGVAMQAGRVELGLALLERSRADIADLLLSASIQPPRVVRNEGAPGKRLVLVGDGDWNAAKGSGGRLPYIAAVGKRGHVRAAVRGRGNVGPFQYLYGHGLSVMLAQALGLPYSANAFKGQFIRFEAIRQRWPSLSPWGLTPEMQAVGRAFLANPTDAILAREIHGWAAKYPSAEPRLRIRHEDGSVESLALHLGNSSTGGVAINVALADGRTFRASCDTGSRGEPDIRPQWAEVAGDRLRCFYEDGTEMFVARPASPESWRSLIGPDISFEVEGIGWPSPVPEVPPAPAPKPPKKKKRPWWRFW